MLPEIELDVLHFFDRTELEGLQMHSRYLRDFVNRHACNLPLRYIHRVDLAHGQVIVRRLKQQYNSILAANGLILHRVSNAFIRRLRLSFRPEDLPVPQYLRVNAGKVNCQVGVLVIDGTEHEDSPTPEIDYTLVDFVGVHLKPHTCEIWMSAVREDYAMLFTHNALRTHVTHLVCQLDQAPAPDCIIPKLFGGGVVQSCAIATEVDPRPWIGKFVETFETMERGMDSVQTVTLLYERPGNRVDFEPDRQPVRTAAAHRRSDTIQRVHQGILPQGSMHPPLCKFRH